MLKGIVVFLLGVLFLFPKYGDAQTRTEIQLLSENTRTPIVGANFHYQKQSGVSDNTGRIYLDLQKADTLYLSHINYGNWSLTGVEIKMAVESGVIYKEEEILQLQPITVIALRPKSPKTEKLNLNIRDKLAHDAGSVLAQSPLIGSIRKSGNYGFDPVLRGFKYEQLNIVINGAQNALAACPNRMDPPTSQIAPNMMDHVEIMKGPHSFRYGTAFGGTINFEAAPARFSADPDYYGRFSASSESNGAISRTEGVVGFQGKRFDIGIFGSHATGKDYKDGSGFVVPSGFKRSSFGANLNYGVTDNQFFTLSATRNIAKDTEFPALPMDLRSDKTSLFNVSHKIKFNSKHLREWHTTGYVTIVDHGMDNLDKQLNPRKLNALTDATTKSYGGRTEGTWIYAKGKIYSGLDLRVETADGTRSREFLMGPMKDKTVFDNVWNGGRISKIGYFAEYHHYFSSFKLIASGRLEYNRAEANDLDAKFAGINNTGRTSDLNPNLSIGGYKEFSKTFSAGLWVGRARRSASLTERFINSFPVGLDAYEMLGNPQLDPEINNQIDLSFSYKVKHTQIDLSFFSAFLQDYISSEIDASLTPTMPSSPGVRRFVNINDAFMAGYELTWRQKLPAGLEQHVNLVYSIGENNSLDEPLPEIAPLDFRYTLSGTFLDNSLQPVVSFRYVMKQDRVSEVFGETETPSFSIMDIKFTYQMLRNIGISAGVQNLFDQAYYEHLNRFMKGQPRAIYAPGRNYFFTIIFDMM